MPIIPRFNQQQEQTAPFQQTMDAWSGLDDKIIKGLMTGTQLRRAGLEEQALKQDMAAKEQSMQMASERQSWARQEQGWRQSDRAMAEDLRVKGAEAAVNLAELQAAPIPKTADSYGDNWSSFTKGGAIDESAIDAEYQRGIDYAKTLPADLQKTYLEGLDKVVRNRRLNASVEGAQSAFGDMALDYSQNGLSQKYKPQMEDMRRRFDMLSSLTPDKQYEESKLLAKEVAAMRDAIETEEYRIAQLPGALEQAAGIVNGLKAGGQWDNHPNRPAIEAIQRSLMFRGSKVDPAQAVSDMTQLANGFVPYTVKGEGGAADQKVWVTQSQLPQMLQNEQDNARIKAVARAQASARIAESYAGIAEAGIRANQARQTATEKQAQETAEKESARVGKLSEDVYKEAAKQIDDLYAANAEANSNIKTRKDYYQYLREQQPEEYASLSDEQVLSKLTEKIAKDIVISRRSVGSVVGKSEELSKLESGMLNLTPEQQAEFDDMPEERKKLILKQLAEAANKK